LEWWSDFTILTPADMTFSKESMRGIYIEKNESELGADDKQRFAVLVL